MPREGAVVSTNSRFLWIVAVWSVVAIGCSSGGSKQAKDAGGGDDGGGTNEGTGGAAHKDSGAAKPDAGPGKDSGTKDSGTSSCGSTASCPSPATCDRSGTTPVCKCPAGYKFDAKCVDIDECADPKLNDCASTAECTNKDGSFTCACPAPAYKGDGKTCECALGFSDQGGKCLANDAKTCASNGDCLHGFCVSGVCCASACDTAPTCKSADGATCENGSTCVFPSLADDTTCDDGNVCTTGDKCASGSCVGDGTAVAPSTACKDNDACGTGYHCSGDANATCDVGAPTDCSTFATVCHSAMCDATTGCFSTPLEDGTLCEDGNPCTVGETCATGTCMGGTAASCDDNNPCTEDGSCVTGTGCPAKVAVSGSVACDDHDPCTTNDHCSSDQACHDTQPLNCDDSNPCTTDSCDPSASGDPCQHTNNTASCQDGNSCTANDTCQNGSCAASGTAYSACGAHATACIQGNPNTCTCEANYVSPAGSCVPDTNECNTSNPCATNADCLDTSSNVGGVQCTCHAGFAGDGTTAGSGCTACNAPNTVVNHACVCDMNGTFAVRMQIDWQWPAAMFQTTVTLEAGTATTYSWLMRKQTYDSDGNLSVVTIPCGATTPDVCSPLFAQAYAQYFTNQAWGTTAASNISGTTKLAYTIPANAGAGGRIALPNAVAGQPYVEPDVAGLVGIHLDDPLGAWPAARSEVGADKDHKGTTNGAYWVDDDSDNSPAASGYAVPPTGATADGTIPDPPVNYTGTSTACPRANANDARYPYNYWPSPAVNGDSIAQFIMATRVVNHLDGTIESCNLIDGSVKGTDNGQMRTNARFLDCKTSSNAACQTSTIDGASPFDGIDTQAQTQHVTSATFVMKRIPAADAATTTCATVRAMTFP